MAKQLAPPPRKARRASQRASQRACVSIYLAEKSLRDLMIEQCKSDGCGWITAYRGTRAALLAAGVPETAFPEAGEDVKQFEVQTLNVCGTGSRELLKGSMRAVGEGYELEIDWGFVCPSMHCAHPAVAELARMMLKDVRNWIDTSTLGNEPDLGLTFDVLAADPRAVDYKPSQSGPRFQLTPKFYKELKGYAMRVFEMVHSEGEVIPVEPAILPKPKERPTLRVVAAGPGKASHG